MKHLLFAVFENSSLTNDIVHELSKNDINGTVLGSTSLKHMNSNIEEDELHFISLRHIDKMHLEENVTFYAILDEEEIEKAREIIHTMSDKFTKIKGGMFVVPVESYEGSF